MDGYNSKNKKTKINNDYANEEKEKHNMKEKEINNKKKKEITNTGIKINQRFSINKHNDWWNV